MHDKLLKTKAVLFGFLFLFLLFFSNDFGLVDIEKTAIITALAIDYDNTDEQGIYEVTAQIAVPEASTTSTENKKSQISGKGDTVAEAIKDIGDVSGWFPQLAFCNLIIIGNGFNGKNVIKVLDYFSKTLRVQDSAVVVQAEKTAKELIESSSPLDKISSFAIQKILLKNPGFDKDTATMDIKKFCEGYYERNGSSHMPLISATKIEKSDSQSSSGQSQSSTGSSSGENEEYVFDASRTALFKNGIMVGTLTSNETIVFNALTTDFSQSTVQITDESDGQNYLLTVIKCKSKTTLDFSSNVVMNISLSAYCKISDQNSENSSISLAQNLPLKESVKASFIKYFYETITSLIEKSKQTQCDFLDIDKTIYRKYHEYYNQYKENYLDVLTPSINILVSGQK